MTDELSRLIAEARALPPPSEDERQASALCFAYGTLACSTNHKPSLAAFWAIASEKYGWTKERFARWAAGRQWWER